MMWDKDLIFALFALSLAEIMWRFVRVLREWQFFSMHYPYAQTFLTALRYGFTFPKLSIYLWVCILILLCSQNGHSEVCGGILERWHLLIIWWIFRYVHFTESTLDYSDMIRSDCGLDYASGMASNYFHGFLKLILSTHDGHKGISDRISEYECDHEVEFAVKRLLILMPNSLYTSPVIKSRLMERQDEKPLEAVRRDRAGTKRPYINDVYRIIIDEKPYYIAVEGATPLVSYLDSVNLNLTSTWQMKTMQQEITIKFYRYLKKLLSQYPETMDQCELVFYNDYTADGHFQDVGDVLCMHIKNMWAKEKNDKNIL